MMLNVTVYCKKQTLNFTKYDYINHEFSGGGGVEGHQKTSVVTDPLM